MNLSEKMERWAQLQDDIANTVRPLKVESDELEKDIQQEVLALGKTQSMGRVTASYRKSKGNGSYNYQSIVMELEPDPEIINKHTQIVTTIGWKAIVDEVGVEDAIKAKHYTPAKDSAPTVTVSLN
jgi:hypothetical protein